jgi:hypothetical protein
MTPATAHRRLATVKQFDATLKLSYFTKSTAGMVTTSNTAHMQKYPARITSPGFLFDGDMKLTGIIPMQNGTTTSQNRRLTIANMARSLSFFLQYQYNYSI